MKYDAVTYVRYFASLFAKPTNTEFILDRNITTYKSYYMVFNTIANESILDSESFLQKNDKFRVITSEVNNYFSIENNVDIKKNYITKITFYLINNWTDKQINTYLNDIHIPLYNMIWNQYNKYKILPILVPRKDSINIKDRFYIYNKLAMKLSNMSNDKIFKHIINNSIKYKILYDVSEPPVQYKSNYLSSILNSITDNQLMSPHPSTETTIYHYKTVYKRDLKNSSGKILSDTMVIDKSFPTTIEVYTDNNGYTFSMYNNSDNFANNNKDLFAKTYTDFLNHRYQIFSERKLANGEHLVSKAEYVNRCKHIINDPKHKDALDKLYNNFIEWQNSQGLGHNVKEDFASQLDIYLLMDKFKD